MVYDAKRKTPPMISKKPNYYPMPHFLSNNQVSISNHLLNVQSCMGLKLLQPRLANGVEPGQLALGGGVVAPEPALEGQVVPAAGGARDDALGQLGITLRLGLAIETIESLLLHGSVAHLGDAGDPELLEDLERLGDLGLVLEAAEDGTEHAGILEAHGGTLCAVWWGEGVSILCVSMGVWGCDCDGRTYR